MKVYLVSIVLLFTLIPSFAFAQDIQWQKFGRVSVAGTSITVALNGTIYYTLGDDLFCSYDHGYHWHYISGTTMLTGFDFYTNARRPLVAINDSVLIGIHNGMDSGVWRSNDTGKTWQRIRPFANNYGDGWQFGVVNNQIVILSWSDTAIRSTDWGQ